MTTLLSMHKKEVEVQLCLEYIASAFKVMQVLVLKWHNLCFPCLNIEQMCTSPSVCKSKCFVLVPETIIKPFTSQAYTCVARKGIGPP